MSIVGHAFNPSLGGKSWWIFKFKTVLIHTASSRPARASLRPCLKCFIIKFDM